MDELIFEFTGWVYQNYGRAGCAISLLIILSFLALSFFLLNLLPESKMVIVWSACLSCKYKRKRSNVFVLTCPKYEMPRFFYFRLPPCPCASYVDCNVVGNQSDPVLFRRDSLLQNIHKVG